MAYNFPDSPSNGDTFTLNGVTYAYNSTKGVWKDTAVGVLPATVTSSDTAPLNPKAGDLWYRTDVSSLYVYYSDGSSSQWVGVSGPAGPAGPAGTDGADGADGADGSSVISYANFAAFPTTNNTAGDFGFAQDTKALYMWDGTEWDRISLGGDALFWQTEALDTYEINTANTQVIITEAIDPEQFSIAYSYDISPTSSTAITNVSESNGDFTLTFDSSTTESSVLFRTKATDGVNTIYKNSTLSLINPFWDNVVFLMSVDTNNNLVDISEATSSPHTITKYGNAAASTNYTKYNTKSVYFDGSGDYLRADTALDGFTGVNDAITIEAWIYNVNTPSAGLYWFGLNRASDGQNTLILGQTEVHINNTSQGTLSTTMSANQWYHYAYVYESGLHKIYLDGTEVFSVTNTSFNTSLSACVFGVATEFDTANGGTPGNYVNGYIENLQVLNIKKYTANFTPPSAAFSKNYQ